MSRTNKIIWTVTEQADFYSAFIEELKEAGVEFPVKASDLSKTMAAARTAMKVIKVERRREMTSIDSIRGDLAKRLIDNGVFPRDYLESLRKKRAKDEPQPDPRDVRIKELEAEIETAEKYNVALIEEKRALQERIAVLENQPSPVDLVKSFFADIIAEGLAKRAVMDKPAGVYGPVKKPEGPLPDFERARRRGDVPDGKPQPKKKVALIGGWSDDHAVVVREFGEKLDLRLIKGDDSADKVRALGDWAKQPGHVVVAWFTEMRPEVERAVKLSIPSPARAQGNLQDLLGKLRGYTV